MKYGPGHGVCMCEDKEVIQGVAKQTLPGDAGLAAWWKQDCPRSPPPLMLLPPLTVFLSARLWALKNCGYAQVGGVTLLLVALPYLFICFYLFFCQCNYACLYGTK